MRKPRVVFVLPALDLAGDEHFVHSTSLMEALHDGGRFEVSAISLRDAGRRWEPMREISVTYLHGILGLRMLQLVKCLWSLRRGDVCYVRISAPALAVALGARLIRRFRVAFWHSTWQRELVEGTVPPDRRLRALLPKVDRLITYPQAAADLYVKCYAIDPRRISLVPNNVELNHLEERVWPGRDGSKRVLFVGRLSPRKGAHDLAAIADTIRRQMDEEVDTVVAGGGPLQDMIERSTNLLSLGSVPNGVVLSLMSQAHVLAFPSYAEGCSRVLQEACRLGLPLVGYDIPPVRAMLGPLTDEFCVPLGDVEAFGDRLHSILTLPAADLADLRIRMQMLGRNFTAVQVASRLESALQGTALVGRNG